MKNKQSKNKTTKIKLDDLTVQSFVTELDDKALEGILGGKGISPQKDTCINRPTGGSLTADFCLSMCNCTGLPGC